MKLRNKIIIVSIISLILPLFSRHLYSVSYDLESFIENYSIIGGVLLVMLNGFVIGMHNQLKWIIDEYRIMIGISSFANTVELVTQALALALKEW